MAPLEGRRGSGCAASGDCGVRADENVLQVAAIKEDAIVARTRDETQGVRLALEERHPGVQVVDEETLAVVAELRNDHQGNILAVHQRIGAHAGAQGYTQTPAADGDTVI